MQLKKNVLEVRNLKKYFPLHSSLFGPKKFLKAVDNVSFDIVEGETFGLVGESGCGKSTTGKTILNLIEATSGEVYYEHQQILNLPKRKMRELRRYLQIIFQDPVKSI